MDKILTKFIFSFWQNCFKAAERIIVQQTLTFFQELEINFSFLRQKQKRNNMKILYFGRCQSRKR